LRPGYLADLAARTLGVAPVLRPATPSRFEPEGPQAELREITQVREAQAPPQQARETVTSGYPQAVDGWAPDVTEPAREPAQSAERSRRTAPTPARAGTGAFPAVDRPPRGFFAADSAGEPGLVPPAQDSWAAPDLSEPAREPAATGVQVPADVATPTPDAAGPGRAWRGPTAEAILPRGRRAPWPEHLVQASRSRQQAQPPGRAGEGVQGVEAAEASSAEPAIVVRIGRVDVRAVQAAPPPASAQRPRPAAGPSLAEHLAARDGRRR
jgi:hypothetical protein